MIKLPIEFPDGVQMTRSAAASLVQVASRFEARVMIERGQKIVNAKSTLGLLSLYTDIGPGMTMVADGEDEKEAVQAMLDAVAALK